MKNDISDTEFQASPEERQLQDLMQKTGASSSEVHDHKVLAAARAASTRMAARGVANRASVWRMPVSLAASFLLGLGIMFLSQATLQRGEPLSIPADLTRGSESGAVDVPVERASADRWREYIEELIYNGEYKLAEAHLRRFNELHPDYSD